MTTIEPSAPRFLRQLLLLVGLTFVAAACSGDGAAFEDVAVGSATIVTDADIEFAEISPFATFGSAQGDFSAGPHATFGIFGAGASSPPHTHSGSYRAVVLSGDMDNPFGTETDPPTLAPGSFWAVPANDEHVTACLTPESECRFFFHADTAFDFTPIDEATEARSEQAVSIPIQELSFDALGPYDGFAPLWGDPDVGPYGALIRVDAGQDTSELAHRSGFTVVPVTGRLSIDADDKLSALNVGSLLEAEANTPHTLTCSGAIDCNFYLFSSGSLEINQ